MRTPCACPHFLPHTSSIQGTSKDADLSPFEVSRRLFEPIMAQASINDQLDLVFADADLVPLLIQVWRV